MKQLTLILLLLLIFIGWGVARAQDPDAPFLFYYDDELNSFVLERADGHDYRLFLADTLPDNAAVTFPQINGDSVTP
jgi:hypothetical protein